MNKLPEISEAEHQVMKVIWNNNPITAMEVIKVLEKTTSWKPKTIKTLLNRLLKKNAIGYDKTGREYNYFPLVEEADFVKVESHIGCIGAQQPPSHIDLEGGAAYRDYAAIQVFRLPGEADRILRVWVGLSGLGSEVAGAGR